MREHVVVCGYGTKGRSAVDALLEDGTPMDRIVVVERDGNAAKEATARGLVVVHGSSSRSEVLRRGRDRYGEGRRRRHRRRRRRRAHRADRPRPGAARLDRRGRPGDREHPAGPAERRRPGRGLLGHRRPAARAVHVRAAAGHRRRGPAHRVHRHRADRAAGPPRTRSAGRRASWPSRSPRWSAAASCATTPTRRCSGSTGGDRVVCIADVDRGMDPAVREPRAAVTRRRQIVSRGAESVPPRAVVPAGPHRARQRPAGRARAGPQLARRRRRGRLRRRHPVRAGGAHRLRPPLRAPDVPGLGEPGEARPLPVRAGRRRHLQRLHPPGLHRLLRDAAEQRAGARRCSSRPTGCAARGSPRRTCATRSTWSRRRSGSTS